jgi:hypothetical protein
VLVPLAFTALELIGDEVARHRTVQAGPSGNFSLSSHRPK